MSSLASKISIPSIPPEQEGGERNYPLVGKETFPHLENYIPRAETYQLTGTMQITSFFHLGLQIVCGKISRLSDKARSTFYVPSSKDVCLPTHFCTVSRALYRFFLKSHVMFDDCCLKFSVKGLTFFEMYQYLQLEHLKFEGMSNNISFTIHFCPTLPLERTNSPHMT